MKVTSLLIAFCLTSLGNSYATPLDNWAESPRPVGTAAVNSVIFGKGLFVAVGYQGTILTSSNGADWVSQNSHSTGDFTQVRFLNGLFFAIAPYHILVSSNGAEW